LPDIWEELGKAGFESGHAYGKALRTVKSCVGSTWCRYGVQDSVSFAIAVENRYKGIRSPHKIKGGVSGCARECAEAQGKDFGVIATEHGYNLYVGGNGGTNPVHAQLLAADIDEDTVLKYLDRYLVYYILTADRLERTAPWQKKLPSGKNGGGPIEHLKEVIIEDSLGICEELDKRMQHLVDTYHDEWVSQLLSLSCFAPKIPVGSCSNIRYCICVDRLRSSRIPSDVLNSSNSPTPTRLWIRNP
jgi:nitrite reductase (NADH) large subunit